MGFGFSFLLRIKFIIGVEMSKSWYVLNSYSGYENNWIKDTFDGDGQFIKSKSLNLTQLSHLEPYAQLDLNGDGVIGNIIYKKFASDHHHGSSNHLIDQLKTYELMSGGYVLSNNEHSINSALSQLEMENGGRVIGPGLRS